MFGSSQSEIISCNRNCYNSPCTGKHEIWDVDNQYLIRGTNRVSFFWEDYTKHWPANSSSGYSKHLDMGMIEQGRIFADRRDAGFEVTKMLEGKYKDQNVLVLGILRGGVVIAYEIAMY